VVGYEAFNPDTQNAIVMLPEELPGFIKVVEAVPFAGFSLESMTIAEHAANNATFGLHDEDYLGGIQESWMYYSSEPENYIDVVVGLASGGSTARIFRSAKKQSELLGSARIDALDITKDHSFQNPKEAFAYYSNKVKELEVSSDRNGAVFYSGPGNMELAEEFAKDNGKVTLETTRGGSWLHQQNLFGADSPLTKRQAATIWQQLSEKYAKEASGNVVGFVKGAKPDRIFNTIEYPALKRNPNVSNVITGGE